MKKRKMKKYIPYGPYCTGCKWRSFVNFKFVSGVYDEECYEEYIPVYQCLYLKLIDHDMSTLLHEGIKICGERDD